MEQKPLHYDGSVQNMSENEPTVTESFKLTDDMRTNIGRNPYSPENE